jgi:hypothetical protein
MEKALGQIVIRVVFEKFFFSSLIQQAEAIAISMHSSHLTN